MGDFRRLPALLFLMLHLVVGMRPAVPLSAASHHEATQVDQLALAAGHEQHTTHAAHANSANAELPCHSDATDSPADDQSPNSEHSSHHDGGCHGAPCCAPVAPSGVVRAIATRDVPIARQRPVSGAARIVFSDGARRRPPATAPPATRVV
jgi:hypothetical protein